MSRVGIIKSVDDKKKEVQILGFGEVTGSVLIEDSEFGCEDDVPTFKLDSGTEMNNSFGYYWAEEAVIQSDLDNYETNGYTVTNLSI